MIEDESRAGIKAGQGKSAQQVEDSTWIGGIAVAGMIVLFLILLAAKGC